MKKRSIYLIVSCVLALALALFCSACGDQAPDAADAVAPYIGEDGYWHIGDINTHVKAAGEDGAEGMDGITPHIGEDNYWYIGDANTGILAEGKDGINGDTPYIGENKHWYIGNTDTGIVAEGTNGKNGANGGTPYIGENKHWYIGDIDLGYVAEGKDGINGDTPQIGEDKHWYIGGKDTGISAEGKDGINGETPYIGANGHWYIGDVDTGKIALGSDGKNGKNADINEIYLAAVDAGYDGNFLEFLHEYLSVEVKKSDETVISECLLCSVRIVCKYVYSDEYIERNKPLDNKYGSSGSGVFYSLDKVGGNALIITNYHVVFDSNANTENKISDDISVFLYGSEIDSRAIKAEFVGGSMTYDLALLKIENNDLLKSSIATVAEFGNSDEIVMGQKVYAVGNSNGDGIVATKGNITIDSEYLEMTSADESGKTDYREIRTDAAVNPGNSGGGLFDENGKLIGIVNAKNIELKVDNMGYALPSQNVKKVVEAILYYCSDGTAKSIKKPLLGMTIQVSDSYAVWDNDKDVVRVVQTIAVKELSAGSAVYDKLQSGDVILSVEKNGVLTVVDRLYILPETMLSCRVGDELTLRFRRGEGEEVQSVVIAVTEGMLTDVK